MTGVGVTATATVTTPDAERYAKQLLSHLSRKSQVRSDDRGDALQLAGGECLLLPGVDALRLDASAPTPDALETIQRVVGSHLERFGQRNELTVTWLSTSHPDTDLETE